MTLTEIGAIILGGGAGYFIIDKLVSGSGKGPSGGSNAGGPLPQSPAPSPEERKVPWHEVLGVAPNASRDEINLAYKRLMSQYHPDRVATAGPELRELAERKSKEINVAYDESLRQR